MLEVTFDDQKVNLPRFGFLDFEPFEPSGQHIRIWNVMVENVTAGTHTIRCAQETKDGTDATTHVFTVSDQPETYPSLSQDISTTPLEAEQNIINALEACGGDAQITTFPNVGHDLNIDDIYSSDLYAWFLEHKKK